MTTMILERPPLRKKLKTEATTTSIETCRYIPDDLLHEIMIRLPNLGSTIRCSAISKRWLSVVSRSDFVPTLMDRLRSKVPLRLLLGDNFSFGDDFIFGNPIQITQGQGSCLPVASAADSFPCCFKNLSMADSTLLATCEDLLLLKISDSYYVCNPLTGQIVMLPDPPARIRGYLVRAGLVSEPASTTTNNNCNEPLLLGHTRYRVMLVFYSSEETVDASYRTVFYSETWQWAYVMQLRVSGIVESCDVVASNGVLYWICLLGLNVLIAFDPFKAVDDHKAFHSVQLPFDEFSDDHFSHGQLRLGLFMGRPRLSHLFREVGTQHLYLKVWDLKYNSDDVGDATGSFPLVHQVKIVAEDIINSMFVSVLAFHPSHNNQIFMLRNRTLYMYDMETNKQVKVAEFHSDKMSDLRIFPFAHLTWPITLI